MTVKPQCDCHGRGCVHQGEYGPDRFRTCWLYNTQAAYRNGPGLPLLDRPQPRSAECTYLEGTTGEVLECRTCQGSVKVKTFRCAKHGTTTLNKPITGQLCCTICPDYNQEVPDPFTGPVTRHLLYHLYPRRDHHGAWQKNVSELLRRIEVFNGRRIVAIVTGDDLVAPDEVKPRFHGTVEEFLVLPNNPERYEVATWVPLWEALGRDADGENTITFHGHSKGTRHTPNPFKSASLLWGEIMYEVLLDYAPLVEKQLQRFKLVGCFKQLTQNNTGGSKHGWFFDGSFRWVRNKHCPPEVWRNIRQLWTGSECWPGDNYLSSDACGLLLSGASMNLYSLDYLRDKAYPALERFRREQARHRR